MRRSSVNAWLRSGAVALAAVLATAAVWQRLEQGERERPLSLLLFEADSPASTHIEELTHSIRVEGTITEMQCYRLTGKGPVEDATGLCSLIVSIDAAFGRFGAVSVGKAGDKVGDRVLLRIGPRNRADAPVSPLQPRDRAGAP